MESRYRYETGKKGNIRSLNGQGPGKIDWTDWSWNPVSGCKHSCEYCYLKRNPSFDMTPAFHSNRLKDVGCLKEPAKVFVGSSGDLFGDWVPNEWIEAVREAIKAHPEHIFQLLTKNPKRYMEFDWSDYQNVWLGATIDKDDRTSDVSYLKACSGKIKFVSFEPLLEEVKVNLTGLDWIIIGANSNRGAKKPLMIWAESLISQARKLGIPVWVKDNYGYSERIKEFPVEKIKEVI